MGEVTKEVVKVAVFEIKLLQDIDDALALGADCAKDCLDDHVGGDDVAHAVGLDFIGDDVEIFLREECWKVHGVLCV